MAADHADGALPVPWVPRAIEHGLTLRAPGGESGPPRGLPGAAGLASASQEVAPRVARAQAGHTDRPRQSVRRAPDYRGLRRDGSGRRRRRPVSKPTPQIVARGPFRASLFICPTNEWLAVSAARGEMTRLPLTR